MARRPDQDRFDRFTRHLMEIDPAVDEFCRFSGYQVMRNQNRAPCRILHRYGPMELIIGLNLDGDWRTLEFSRDMLHSLGIAAYFQPAAGKRLWRNHTIVEHVPFSYVRDHIVSLLNEAAAILEKWEVPDIPDDAVTFAPEGWERTRV